MTAILQRVASANVVISGECVGEIGRGFLVLLGVAREDTAQDAEMLADKITKLRVFSDADGKMNLSVTDVSGGILVVPNFTLLASCRKGNRPDFFGSAPPDVAKPLFETFCSLIEERISTVGRGVFGADMKVSLVNDGPVTIILDTDDLKRSRRS